MAARWPRSRPPATPAPCAARPAPERTLGRSTSITGPYLDAAGTDMMNGGGMEVQGTDAGMIGPGGEYVFASGGASDLVYHYYDSFGNGAAWVQVRPLTWVDGWPVTGRALVPVPGEPGLPGS